MIPFPNKVHNDGCEIWMSDMAGWPGSEVRERAAYREKDRQVPCGWIAFSETYRVKTGERLRRDPFKDGTWLVVA